MKITRIVSSISMFFLLWTPVVNAFNEEPHLALSGHSVATSGLDDFLRVWLRISGGIGESFSDGTDTKTVVAWVQEGSAREDDLARPLNHFHNPLRTWNSSYPFPLGFSSIIWGQGDGVSNEWRWQNARVKFFNGWVATDQAVRDQNLALMFRTLGHQIHLIQDASVPAHSRLDRHPIYDGFEVYADRIVGTPLFDQLTVDPNTGMPTRYDPSILTLGQNPLAPIPIARIIDTTDPDQTEAVPSTGTNIGIAEYSNANFMSDGQDGTIFRRERLVSGPDRWERCTVRRERIRVGSLFLTRDSGIQ